VGPVYREVARRRALPLHRTDQKGWIMRRPRSCSPDPLAGSRAAFRYTFARASTEEHFDELVSELARVPGEGVPNELAGQGPHSATLADHDLGQGAAGVGPQDTPAAVPPSVDVGRKR
jgi:hypothetical protein